MGELTDLILEGSMCSHCGTMFEKEHGHPVACASCWRGLSKKEREELPKAINREV